MKVMMFMKTTEGTEDAAPPSPEALLAMHNYNEALMAAGIQKDQILGGLLPTRYAKRVRISAKDKSLTVIDGPFTETKEVIAGFALWEVKSMEEALEWAKKCPVTMDGVFEMRPLFSPETWDPK
jgi:hypothetical protein